MKLELKFKDLVEINGSIYQINRVDRFGYFLNTNKNIKDINNDIIVYRKDDNGNFIKIFKGKNPYYAEDYYGKQ